MAYRISLFALLLGVLISTQANADPGRYGWAPGATAQPVGDRHRYRDDRDWRPRPHWDRPPPRYYEAPRWRRPPPPPPAYYYYRPAYPSYGPPGYWR